jgi:sugar-specific transcriptional regulator TrmB
MQKAVSRLTALGFTDYEARAYTTLLKDSPLSAYEIAKFSGIPSSKIYEVVRRLENKNTIQSIRGARTRLFIPVPPEEFIRSYRISVEQHLNGIREELKGIRVGIDTSYTWHITGYEDLMLRAKRMTGTAENTLLMLVWPEEFGRLQSGLEGAEARGVRISAVHYGTCTSKVGIIFHHPPDETIQAQRGVRGLTIVADAKEALVCTIRDGRVNAIWSMNEAFVIMAEDYIRHDIFFLKTMKRFAPEMQKLFGSRFEKMLDLFSDENI